MAELVQVDDFAKPKRPAIGADLLAGGLRGVFSDDVPQAICFGRLLAVYLCSDGGSHRIAAMRAAYKHEGKVQPHDLGLHSIEPREALKAFLARFEVLAAIVPQKAVTAG